MKRQNIDSFQVTQDARRGIPISLKIAILHIPSYIKGLSQRLKKTHSEPTPHGQYAEYSDPSLKKPKVNVQPTESSRYAKYKETTSLPKTTTASQPTQNSKDAELEL